MVNRRQREIAKLANSQPYEPSPEELQCYELYASGAYSYREVAEKLRRLEQAARSSENLMPPLLESVKAYATLGEMMGVFREVFGEYQPSWGL